VTLLSLLRPQAAQQQMLGLCYREGRWAWDLGRV